jgi:hypothetical protein
VWTGSAIEDGSDPTIRISPVVHKRASMKACPRIPLIMLFLLAMVTIPAQLAAQNGRTHPPAIITFDPPRSAAGPLSFTNPTNINADGVITGYFSATDNLFHGFLRYCGREGGGKSCGAKAGTFQIVDVSGAVQGTFAISRNPMGAVTGDYGYSSGGRGFLMYCSRRLSISRALSTPAPPASIQRERSQVPTSRT